MHEPPIQPTIDESTIEGPTPQAVEEVDQPLTFQIMESASERGKRKLIDSNGFSYNVKRQRLEATDWQCTVRLTGNRCKATVVQRPGNLFEFGRNHHNHAAPVGGMVAAKLKSLIKQEARQDVFRPASEVVNDALLSELTDAPCPSLPCVDSLQRTANRTRQQLRPQDPKDLDLDLDLQMEHIPDGSFREDVKIRGRRHLVFASDKQLELLQQSKTWYIDGTFKLCRQPFTQLLTLNAFVKNDDHMKQVPLVFVIMSGKKRRDYKAVFDAVISILPSPPRVT